MFVEIGTFSNPKTVLCMGMLPDPGGVVLHYLHSNCSRLELATEQIAGLTHHQLSLALKEPPFDAISPFLNLKRENVPAIVEWCQKLEEGWRPLREKPPQHKINRNILVDIGTFTQPRTISPIVFQPDDDGHVMINYLKDEGSSLNNGHLTVHEARIVGLSYKELLMAFRYPSADSNSPFLNLKVENIPALVDRLRRTPAAENSGPTARPALRVVPSGVRQWLGAPRRAMLPARDSRAAP